jgi:hypothetical protein
MIYVKCYCICSMKKIDGLSLDTEMKVARYNARWKFQSSVLFIE